MDHIDHQQMFSALMGLVIVLFLMSGQRVAAPWRCQFRIAAIALFLVAAAMALVEVALWLAGMRW